MMSTILAGLSSVELRDCMKFEEEGSLYCSFKDVSRQGSQHVESLSVILSGSQNEGVSYCDDEHNPFFVESGGVNGRIVILKKFWQKFFPSMVTLQNSKVPAHLLSRGFCKKTTKVSSSTPNCSSSSSSSSSSSASSSSSSSLRPPPKSSCTSDFHDLPPGKSVISQNDYQDEYFSIRNDTLEIDITPEKQSSRQLFQSGDISDSYVIDRIMSKNKGYCSLIVTGSTPLQMEFNLDETCDEPKVFDSLPGTHRWMLYKDIVRGELVIRRGCYLSITSVLPDGRVTCCVESVGPSDVLWNDSPQLYKLHRDYFRMPELYFSSPLSIEG
jgi:hypothetical protein